MENTPPPEIPHLFTLMEAAKITKYNDQYLRELCRGRRISFVLRRGRYFFTAEDLNFIMAGEHMEAAPPSSPKIEKGNKGKK
jgi:hypothetical protein